MFADRDAEYAFLDQLTQEDCQGFGIKSKPKPKSLLVVVRHPDGIYNVVFGVGRERYTWTGKPGAILRSVGASAANPELSLTWYQAATISMAINSEEMKSC